MIMKIKKFLAMMVAATTMVFGVYSCGSDDDENEPEKPVAAQVAGSYEGQEVIKVMGEVSSDTTTTYSFAKATDLTVDMTIPGFGMGPMTIPSFPVKEIPLTKGEKAITGKLDSYRGTVTDGKGQEKAYTVSDIVVAFDGKTVAVTYSLKYGAMPMAMVTTFTGTKK